MAEAIYDVAIIGSGPAGYTAAIRAGQLGLKTLLLEKDNKLGGTCLHWGCIPTKTFLYHADIYEHLTHAKDWGFDGISPEQVKINWANIQARKAKILTKHANGLTMLMKKNKVTVMEGTGRLTGAAQNGVHTIELAKNAGGNEKIQTRNVILATGSGARMLPGYTPDPSIMTNMEILSLDAIPKSLIVIGSGAVGVEFASVYKSFGSEVTVIEALDRMVPLEDEEISKELARQFKKRVINTQLGAKVTKINKTKGGVSVEFTDSEGKNQKLDAEKVLVAVGRAPRSEGIGIEKTKIKTERGFVKTNEWMQTEEPGVWAIGDVVWGTPQLAHVGAMEGIVAVHKIANRPVRPLRLDRIPNCTYCEPQIASVGLTEKAAREKGLNVKVGKFPWVGNSKATIIDNHNGFIKVVADAKYGEILGVHIIGPSATELIGEAVAVMELEGTVDDLVVTVHAHPTLYEGMLDAFNAVQGMTINV